MRALTSSSSQRLILVAIFILSSSAISAQWLSGQPAVTTGTETITAVSPSTYYGIAGSSFYKSTDGAATWTNQPLNFPTYSIFQDNIFAIFTRGIKFTSLSNGFIYGTNIYGYQIIHRTTDSGVTWFPVHNRAGGDLFDMVKVDPLILVACGAHGRIERSADGGATWSDVSSPTTSTLYSVTFSSATTGYAVGDNVILKTSDAGLTWTSTMISAQLRSVSFANANVGFAVGNEKVMMKTNDGGQNWAVVNPEILAPVQSFVKVLFVNGTTGFLATSHGLFKTPDLGNFWTLQHSMPAFTVTLLDFYDSSDGIVNFLPFDFPYQNLIYKTAAGGEPIPQHEAAVVAFEPRTGSDCRGTYPVRVKISNFGASPLTSATLKWTVGGIQQPDFSWTGNIASGDTSALVTVGSFDFNKTNFNFDITVATSQPNGQPDDYVSNDQLAFQLRFNKLTGSYTIGGVSPDFTTINQAITLLNSWHQCGHVVLNIRSGVYAEHVIIENMTWLSPASTLTLQSESGNADDVSISASAVGVIHLDNSPYTHIRNLKVTANGTAAIMMEGVCDGVLIEGNKLSNPVNAYYLSALFLLDVIGDTEIRGNHFEDSWQGVYYGYSQNHLAWSGGVTVIEGNVFNHQVGAGIYADIFGQSKLVIRKNKFFSRASATNYWSINFLQQPGNAQIENNYFQITGTSCGAMLANRGTYTFNFNTVYKKSPDTMAALWFQNLSHSSFRNNNIFNDGAGGCFDFGISVEGEVTSDYNNLFTTGLLLGKITANDRTGVSNNLATWRSASGFDLHSISTDPQLVLDSVHIQPNSSNYALLQAGIPVPGITTDIDGDTRNATAPVIGCDEFTRPAIDLGIALMAMPAIACGPIATGVKITNYGSTAVPDFSIEWGRAGSLTTVPVNTPLASGASVNVSLGNLSLPETSVIKTRVIVPGDVIGRNDTTSVVVKTGGVSGTYVIGATGNYTTFQEAFDALKVTGICGPVTLNVQTGSYTENLTIPEIPGASAVNSITLQSQTHSAADVTLAVNAPLKIDGTDWLTVQYLTITNAVPGITIMEIANGATHVAVQHNRMVVNVYSQYGILSGSDAVNEYLTIADNVFEPITAEPGMQVISAIALNISVGNNLTGNINDQNIVSGNTFNVLCTASTISLPSQQNFSIIGNTITNSKLGIELNRISGSYIVSNNRISAEGGIFITESISQDVPTGLLANNVITTTTLPAFRPTNTDNFQFLHNTCITQSGEATLAIDRDAYNNPLADNVTIKNNVVVAGSSANCLTTNTVLRMVCDYNVYYSRAPSVFMYNNGSFLPTENVTEFFPGLFPWQQRSGQDVHSIFHLPMFASDGSYHIDGDMLVDNKGTPTSVLIDADGVARSATTPDPGAYEFSASHSANDAGITLIERPSQCGDSFTIKANVHNYGTNTLTQATVNWTLNGQNKPPVSWTGSLGPAGEAEFILGDVVFHPSDSNEVIAWTSLPNGTGDSHIENDSTTLNNIYQKLSGSYIVGSIDDDFPTFVDASNYLSTIGVCGPVQLSIRPGVYNQILKLRLIPGLGTDAPLMIAGDPMSPVILKDDLIANSYYSAPYIILLDETHDITIQGLNFEANRGPAIKYHGSVTGTNITGNKFTNGSSTIDFSYGGSYNDNTISGNTFDNTGFSIMIESDAVNTKIIDNQFSNHHQQAVLATALNMGTIIQRNTINAEYGTQTALNLVASFNALIAENHIVGSFGNGIVILESGDKNLPVSIVNNIISGIADSPNLGCTGIYALGCKNLQINYNTISTLSSPASEYTPISMFLYADSMISVQNNIVTTNGNGYIYELSNGPMPAATLDNNNYWTTAPNFAYIDFVAPDATFDDFRIRTGYDAHSTNFDPKFFDESFTPSNAVVNGTAIPLGAVTIDINNRNRDATHPDVGAVEFDVIPLDAGLSVLSDQSWLCQPTPEYTFRLSNSGQTTITSVEFSWSLNGVNQAPVTWTGSLVNGASVNYALNNVSFPVEQQQTIHFQITAVNGGADGRAGNNEVTQTFVIHPSVQIGPDIATCDANVLVSVLNPQSFVEYDWTGPTGSLVMTPATQYNAGLSGLYIIRGKDGNGCFSYDSLVVTIYNVAITSDSPAILCGGDSITLKTSPTYDSNFTLTWTRDGNVISSSVQGQLIATEPGSYKVEVSNGTCSVISAPFNVTAGSIEVAITSDSPASICAGSSITLKTLPTFGSNYTVTWMRDGFEAFSPVQGQLVAAASGSYTVAVSNGSCSVISDPFNVTVDELPHYVIHADGKKLFVDAGASHYQWYLDDEIMTDSTSNTIYPITGGSYKVEVTANGCSGFSDPYALVITGLDDHDTALTVYPNPTTGRAIIRGVDLATNQLHWQDLTGKSIPPPITTQQGKDLLVDLKGFAQGVYLLQLKTQDATLVRRIVLIE